MPLQNVLVKYLMGNKDVQNDDWQVARSNNSRLHKYLDDVILEGICSAMEFLASELTVYSISRDRSKR